jgi:hypothetical protein
MQVARVKASYSYSSCEKLGVIFVCGTLEVFNELLCLSFNLIVYVFIYFYLLFE